MNKDIGINQKKYLAFVSVRRWLFACAIMSETLTHQWNILNGHDQEDEKEFERMNDIFMSNVHYFTIIANRVFQIIEFSKSIDVYTDVEFGEIMKYNKKDIRDIRNMNEHDLDYCNGKGRFQEKWFEEKEGSLFCASFVCGSIIGGRLDWIEFGRSCSNTYKEIEGKNFTKYVNYEEYIN